MPCPVTVCQNIRCHHMRKLALGVAGAALLVKVGSTIASIMTARKVAALNADNKRDVVYLHCAIPLGTSISLGAPAVKVIGFLKLHKIPHVIRYTMDNAGSPNGLMPFMVLNGVATSESEVILDVIAKTFKIDEAAGLTAQEAATGHLVRIAVEEHARFCISRCQMVDNFNVIIEAFGAAVPYPRPILKMFLGRYRKNTIETLDRQGNGMLSDERYTQEFVETIKTLETVLGDKKYFVSNATITRYDLAAYSWLSQAIRHEEIRSPAVDYIRNSAKISAFLQRIRETVYPDAAAIIAAFKTSPTQSFI